MRCPACSTADAGELEGAGLVELEGVGGSHHWPEGVGEGAGVGLVALEGVTNGRPLPACATPLLPHRSQPAPWQG